jgi:hypothetical protein
MAAIGVALLCIVFADAYLAISLVGRTNLIRWPFNELWWKLAICAPASAISLWAFSRPKRAI